MSFHIRPYSNADYEMVKDWATQSTGSAPLPGMLREESTFVLEIDDVPALSLSLYCTNTPEIAYLENLVGNPELKGEKRHQGANVLVDAVCSFAKVAGYKRVLAFTNVDKLKERYLEFGLVPTLHNVTSFVREL